LWACPQGGGSYAVAWKVATTAEVGATTDCDSFCAVFLGIPNYVSEYVPKYAEAAAILMKKLQVGLIDGKKGSQKKIEWGRVTKLDERILNGDWLRLMFEPALFGSTSL